MQVTYEISGERLRGRRGIEAVFRLLLIMVFVLGGTTLLGAAMPPSPLTWAEVTADHAASPSPQRVIASMKR